MNRSILTLAVAVAASTIAAGSAAEARGLRVGFGIGASGGLSPLADPTILQNAERRQRINQGQTTAADRQPSTAAAQRERAAAAAAQAAEAKRKAASQAAEARRLAAAQAAEAKRQAAADAAVKANKSVVIARPANTSSVAVLPATLAGGDKALEQAQEEQRAKAEKLLKSLGTPTPVAAPTPPVVTPPAQSVPQTETVIIPSAAEPPPVIVVPVTPPSKAPPKAASTGECRRFIPGAGITVKVACTEQY